MDERNAGVVLWDFDGTLAWRRGRWSGCLVEALDKVLPGHGHVPSAIAAGLQKGFPWHDPGQPHPGLDTDHAWWRALSPVLSAAYQQAGVDAVTAAAAVEQVPGVYVDPRYWVVFDDSRPALERLRAVGWRHIILSNHVPALGKLVGDLGLGDLFDAVLTSAVTGYEKPHPQMFALAREAAGRPPRLWMVGDSRSADIAGAEQAGIPALLARTSPDGHRDGLTLHQVADEILR